jgi:hypothetical protein
MATMLLVRDSTAKLLRFARRHVRLCDQVKGAKKIAENILQPMAILKVKENERLEAVILREDAYDDVVLCDSDLDDAVRTTFEKIKQYDRENSSSFLGLFFPAHGFTELIRKPYSQEPQEVKNIVIKLNGLEDGHPLKSLADDLLQKVEASFAAWDNYQKAVILLKEMRAAEELAKLAVRKQYESNWLDARKEFGVTLADKIFPKVSKHAAKNGDEGDDDDISSPDEE